VSGKELGEKENSLPLLRGEKMKEKLKRIIKLSYYSY
jgi:hypothetical protein